MKRSKEIMLGPTEDGRHLCREERFNKLMFSLFSYLRAEAFLTLLKASLRSVTTASYNISRPTTHKRWWHLDATVLCVEDRAGDKQRAFLLPPWGHSSRQSPKRMLMALGGAECQVMCSLIRFLHCVASGGLVDVAGAGAGRSPERLQTFTAT